MTRAEIFHDAFPNLRGIHVTRRDRVRQAATETEQRTKPRGPDLPHSEYIRWRVRKLKEAAATAAPVATAARL